MTGATTVGGAFSADNLIDLTASIAEPYARSNASAWLMRNASLAAVRKLKNPVTGDYLFSLDVVPGSGASGTLLGRPVFVDPNVAPIGTSAKSVIFGDLSKYWVRQVRGIRFERSEEFKFDYDVVSFRAIARLDGATTDTNALAVFRGGTS